MMLTMTPLLRDFMNAGPSNPIALTKIPNGEFMKRAGHEGAELIMWLVARGAMNAKVHEVYQHYHVSASLTAAGLACYTNL